MLGLSCLAAYKSIEHDFALNKSHNYFLFSLNLLSYGFLIDSDSQKVIKF